MPQAAPQLPQRARLAVWSPGTFRSLSGDEFTFTEGDLSAIAAGYSPTLFAAPLVKGHPKTDDPAQGWANGLEWDGAYLWANLDKVDPAFADEWRAGRWGKVSPRFFLPDEPGNPTPGHYYLRHIGMLGAAAPANKALPMAEFAEGEGTVTFVEAPDLPAAEFGEAGRWGFMALADLLRRLRELVIVERGIDVADQLAPEHLISTLREASDDEAAPQPAFAQPQPKEPAMPDPANPTAEQQAAFAEQQAALAEREAALAAREKTLAEQAAAAHRAECAAFAEQLAEQGRIAPGEAPFVTALLAGIEGDAVVAFAEGDQEITAPTGKRLREFLARLPQQIDYQAAADPEADEQESVPAFAAPNGYQVDAGRAELHRKALAYQKANNCDYATAAIAVGA